MYVLISQSNHSTSVFSHGHTYQGHPVGCAAALEVQRIIREDNLIENVRENGEYLGKLLHGKLDDHPNVGNIRGRGFFWSVSYFLSQNGKGVANTFKDGVCSG